MSAGSVGHQEGVFSLRVHLLRVVGPGDEEMEWSPPIAAAGALEDGAEDAGAEPDGTRVEEARHVHACSEGVGALLARQAVAVRPELSGTEALRVLVEYGVPNAPVVDEGCRPIGVLSTTDLIRELYEEVEEPEWGLGDGCVSLDGRTAADLMTSPARCVRLGSGLLEAAELMVREHLHRLPIISESGELVGVLDALEVLGWVVRRMHLADGSPP